MPIIKSRPRISLRIPRTIHAGDQVDVTVLLDAKKAIPVDFIDLWLRGQEWTAVGGGKSRTTYRHDLVRQRARLRENSELDAGHTNLRARFALPERLPPALYSNHAGTNYELELHVSIPWWPDARRRFQLPLTLPAMVRDEPAPKIHTTRVGGPLKREPHVEFSLQNTFLVPGEALRGQLALYNVQHNRYRTATLSLVAMIDRKDTYGRRRGAFEAHRYSVKLRIDDAAEGASIPFGMQLPKELEPSFTSHLWSIAWHFELSLKIAWGSDLTASTQVLVMPAASTARAGSVKATQIGSGRVRAVWERVGREHGYELQDEALMGRFGGTRARISIDRSGDYVTLKGELVYPSLGIMLDGGERSGLKRVFQKSVSVDGDKWDRKHYVTSREPAQATAFVNPLAPLLIRMLAQDMEDTRMTLARRGGGQSHRHLADFAAVLAQLAARLDQARRAIPPPEQMKEAQPAWHGLAETLGGTLRVGDMEVRGRFEGREAEVRTVWSEDNEPLYTELVLHSGHAVSERHQLVWAAQPMKGNPDELPAAARKIYDALIGEVESLTIAPDRLVVWQSAPAMDSGPLLARLEELDALDRALEGRRGPYR